VIAVSSYLHHKPPLLLPQSSSYHTSAFAQSIFQGTHPSSSYSTPPPGITISSSSLAFALGDPASSFAGQIHQPEQSSKFFRDFLSQKTQEINTRTYSSTDNQTPLRRQTEILSNESPDPIALQPITPRSSVPMQTPRKRKPIVQIESPTIKRQSTQVNSVTPPVLKSAAQTTPTLTSPSKRPATLAYVEIPRSPWLTPSSSRKFDRSGSLTSFDGMPVKTGVNELGDYGSDYSPTKNSDTHKSSRRTGDRDERGMCLSNPLENRVNIECSPS
jgi:cohesin loading factor subunit SCC2